MFVVFGLSIDIIHGTGLATYHVTIYINEHSVFAAVSIARNLTNFVINGCIECIEW